MLKLRVLCALHMLIGPFGLGVSQWANTRTWVEDGWQKTEVTGRGWRIARRKA
jgi:hypothetical protein